jgi:hypothetical protein
VNLRVASFGLHIGPSKVNLQVASFGLHIGLHIEIHIETRIETRIENRTDLQEVIEAHCMANRLVVKGPESA